MLRCFSNTATTTQTRAFATDMTPTTPDGEADQPVPRLIAGISPPFPHMLPWYSVHHRVTVLFPIMWLAREGITVLHKKKDAKDWALVHMNT
jgi:hypothetical protein